MARALILGTTGMLGSAVEAELRATGVYAQGASRTQGLIFDASKLELADLFDRASLKPGDYVVNCVGLTKSRIDEASLESRSSAVRLNFNFPQALAFEADSRGIKVIQVATDCVYSGLVGDYLESSPHDALDVYGKTKSLGEAPSDSVMHLRCSLIGPELGRSSLFYEWVRQQPQGAHINGYTNHIWNGLSAKAFGKVVAGIIGHSLFNAGVQHLVPEGKVTKDQLVRIVLSSLARPDVEVLSVEAASRVDRTLSTLNKEFNQTLFEAAGYSTLPTITEMVAEISSDLSN